MRKIIVGSRRSKLALTQTNWFINELKKLGLPYEFEVKEIVTKGDRILDVTLSKVGGKGLFVKEIESALLNKEIDFAVHSMKDMPSELPLGLMLGCVPKREDARDAFLSDKYTSIKDLPSGAVIGTSSLRRSAQLMRIRPDLEMKWIRGNIDTRIEKMQNEEYDAIILAASGLHRMGWGEKVITEYISVDSCIPAVGQGALGIECRSDDEDVLSLLKHLECAKTAVTTLAERTFLYELQGGCQVPIAGYATLSENGDISLTGLVAHPSGEPFIVETQIGKDPVALGKSVAKVLKDKGAISIIEEVKAAEEK